MTALGGGEKEERTALLFKRRGIYFGSSVKGMREAPSDLLNGRIRRKTPYEREPLYVGKKKGGLGQLNLVGKYTRVTLGSFD